MTRMLLVFRILVWLEHSVSIGIYERARPIDNSVSPLRTARHRALQLVGARGVEHAEHGELRHCPLPLGSSLYHENFIVAGLDDLAVILSLDFLRANEAKIELDLSQIRMKSSVVNTILNSYSHHRDGESKDAVLRPREPMRDSVVVEEAVPDSMKVNSGHVVSLRSGRTATCKTPNNYLVMGHGRII
jgi:hypothetical protein